MFPQLVCNESWNQFISKAEVKHCEMDGQIVRHVDHKKDDGILKTLKYMRKAASRSSTTPCDFHHVRKKFTNSKVMRQNADQRLFWKFDGIYLVKRFFTFGVVTPAPGWGVSIVVGNAEMDLYITNQFFEFGYLPKDDKGFKVFQLKPGERVVVNQPFILVAKRICMFCIQLCEVIIPDKNSVV